MSVNIIQKKATKVLFFLAAFITSSLGAIQPPVVKGEQLIYQGKIEEAFQVLGQEAEKGNPRALYLLGCLHTADFNSKKDYEKGILSLRRAADQNYPPALTELAHLYFSGEGITENKTQARMLYRRAADSGYGPAQFNCGIMYKKGQGGEKDLKLGYYYLCLASINTDDLDGVAEDAASYRDQIAPLLSPADRQDVLAKVARTVNKTS